MLSFPPKKYPDFDSESDVSVPSDPAGSWTGKPYIQDEPEQDPDDL